MKYLKKYNENIDFDDISEEEFDDSIPYDFIGHENFYEFLVNNNIYYKYINYFNPRYSAPYSKYLKDFLDKKGIKYFIVSAFDWSKTIEGHTYWDTYSHKWKQEY